MPKYAQTLIANSYTANDVSARLKEAFDNLGWGTGKVDIPGGYRFTATDQTNSDATPLVVNSSEFIDNYQGTNIIRASSLHNFGAVAMYLPGVRSFRIKYTIVGSGNVTWGGNDGSGISSIKGWYLSCTPGSDFNRLTEHWRMTDLSPATPSATGQYYTNWVGNGDIVAYPTITFSLNDNVSIVIDAVEWKVDQNKFAFQSPNLDSPTFELNSRTHSGNHLTTMIALPIKNSKVPMVRVGQHPVRRNDYMRAPSVAQAHTSILYNTHPDQSSVGQHKVTSMCEIIAYGRYGKDMIIRVGSNTTFDGFYLNTAQDNSYNGTVWDTVDKSTGFPTAVPQYTSVRKTAVSSPRMRSDNFTEATYITSDWESAQIMSNYVFEVKNTINLSEIQIPEYYRANNSDTSYVKYKKYSIAFSRLKPVPRSDGTYEVDSVIVPSTEKVTPITGNKWFLTSLPINREIAPGLYCVSVITPDKRSDNSYPGSYENDDFSDFQEANISRDFRYLFSTTLATIPSYSLNGIRYIRDTHATGGDVHWVEVQAFVGSTNVALNKPVTGAGNYRNNSVITDGRSSDTYEYSYGRTMTVDLGSVFTVDTLKIWRYYADGRTYNSILEVSENGVDWVDITPAPYAETSAGKTIGITYPYTAQNLKITNPSKISPGILIGGGNNPDVRDNRIVPLTQAAVRLVQSASATPVSTKTMFAENWVTLGRAWSHWGYVPKLNKIDRDTVYNIMGGYYKNINNARFVFGLDIQLGNWGDEFLLSPQPSSVFKQDANDLGNFGNRQDVEFGKKTSLFNDGRPYRRAWVSSIWGTSLQLNNIFILNGGGINMNSSYVTDDGREYVIVYSSVNGNNWDRSDQSFAFRLR